MAAFWQQEVYNSGLQDAKRQPNAFNANTYSRGWPILSTISSWVWSLPGTALMRSRGVQWALGFDSSHCLWVFFSPNHVQIWIVVSCNPHLARWFFTHVSLTLPFLMGISTWQPCHAGLHAGHVAGTGSGTETSWRGLWRCPGGFYLFRRQKMWRLVQYEQHKGTMTYRNGIYLDIMGWWDINMNLNHINIMGPNGIWYKGICCNATCWDINEWDTNGHSQSMGYKQEWIRWYGGFLLKNRQFRETNGFGVPHFSDTRR